MVAIKEIWKPVIYDNVNPVYEVSSQGNVKNTKNNKLCKLQNKNG
jgi:hypothetical protein